MTVAEYLADFIEKKGIKNVFQLSGGMITQLIDKIDERESINVHSLLHEQSCAFAISAIGRISKKPSVALATSGPGATNLITGIGDCYFDSVPAIFITGQVNTFEIKPNNAIRQLGFQETDILSMVKPITKLAVQIKNPQDIIKQLDLAYSTSINGRHGPVLIDIPMDIQRSQIKLDDWDTLKSEIKSVNQIKNIESVINTLTNSKKPIIWAGNGIHSSNSEDLFKEFVKITNIPSVFTLHGIDILNFFDPNRIGFIGSYGNRSANKAVKEADCIIFLGSRIDIRQTGSNMSIFENKKIIRVDCEEGELTNRLDPHIKVNCDVKVFLNELLVKIKSSDFKLNDWHEELISLKREYPAENEIGNTEFVNPISFFKCLSKESLKPTIYNVDVGSHQMWSAQSLEFKNGDRFLTSGGMGSMG
ncbi:thiamine pyrophosphate-binding protein, partial [Flavobacteriaceae bacterium]|nr:thiamine pyrophosphate-binding protein [Flavobacteriaceae bacterium]